MKSVSVGLGWVMVAACIAVVLGRVPARADLALEISADKTQYLVDEPLYVTVVLTNSGDREARTLRLFHPGAHILSFEIAPPGLQPHWHKPWVEFSMVRDGFAKAAVRLGPGEQYSAVVDLTYDGKRGIVLSRAGEYVIGARYVIGEDLPAGLVDVRSNELRIVVKEPEGVDRGAHEVLKKGARTHDQGPWNSYAEQRGCYEELVGKFPRSGYAPYTRYYLGHVCQCDGTFKSLGKRGTPEGAARIRRAAELYRDAAGEMSDTAFGAKAMRVSARAFAKVGDTARAEALFEEAFTLPAATDADRLEVLSWLKDLEGGLFHHDSGLARQMKLTRLRLPLRRFAEAMGLLVEWDPEKQYAKVTGRGVKAVVWPGEHPMLISGGYRTDVTVSVRNGRVLVSRSVIEALMAAQLGRDASQEW